MFPLIPFFLYSSLSLSFFFFLSTSFLLYLSVSFLLSFFPNLTFLYFLCLTFFIFFNFFSLLAALRVGLPVVGRHRVRHVLAQRLQRVRREVGQAFRDAVDSVHEKAGAVVGSCRCKKKEQSESRHDFHFSLLPFLTLGSPESRPHVANVRRNHAALFRLLVVQPILSRLEDDPAIVAFQNVAAPEIRSDGTQCGRIGRGSLGNHGVKAAREATSSKRKRAR